MYHPQPPPVVPRIEIPSRRYVNAPGVQFLGKPPTTQVGHFRGPEDTLRMMADLALGDHGERSMLVRHFANWITRDIWPKDYLGEILAIRNAFVQPSPWKRWGPLFRYANDARHVEVVKSPLRQVEEILETGSTTVDCLPESTLVLTRDYRFVRMDSLVPGTVIWGLDGWTKVKAVAYKGSLPVSALRMNNGSTVLATEGHKFSVELCQKHDEDWARSRPCSCDDRKRVTLRLHNLQQKMVLSQPERIEFGFQKLVGDKAYLEGLYISDGWSHGTSGFCISGQDGCPKEEQKRAAQAICKSLGVETTWHRKHIYIAAGANWMSRVSRMGKAAPEKRLLSIDLSEEAAAGYLRGIMADSGRNTGAPPTSRTFTTTSRQLMLQTRILHRMFGISCGYSYIENHGGLGMNPIWRLSTRTNKRKLRVKEIFHDVTELPCYDLETESGYVYLPEHDVTVHNCDEIAACAATFLLQHGREVEFVALGFEPESLSHVGLRAREPKSNEWIWLDGVAGPKEREAAQRAKELLVWSLD